MPLYFNIRQEEEIYRLKEIKIEPYTHVLRARYEIRVIIDYVSKNQT